MISPLLLFEGVSTSLVCGEEFRYLTEHDGVAAVLIRTVDREAHSLHLLTYVCLCTLCMVVIPAFNLNYFVLPAVVQHLVTEGAAHFSSEEFVRITVKLGAIVEEALHE